VAVIFLAIVYHFPK